MFNTTPKPVPGYPYSFQYDLPVEAWKTAEGYLAGLTIDYVQSQGWLFFKTQQEYNEVKTVFILLREMGLPSR